MRKFIKKLIRWSVNTKILSFPRRILGRIVTYAITGTGFLIISSIISYSDPERIKIIDLINKIKEETNMMLANNEAYQIFTVAKRTEKIKGDLAEIGVYKGGSAKLICEAKGDRGLHLFDTFEGIPKVEEIDRTCFCEGMFAASFEDVKNYLKEYKNVYFYKGLFPATAQPIKGKKFSFVNLDVDTYGSNLSCLKFFYPRMNRGGIIIAHDYVFAAGVRKAFDEFFKDKPEPIIEMSGTQCLLVKL